MRKPVGSTARRAAAQTPIHSDPEQSSLFGAPEMPEMPAKVQVQEKSAGAAGAQSKPVQYPRTAGRCIKELKFWTGRVAVECGTEVWIERNPDKTMIYVLYKDGRMAYTFQGLTQLNEFRNHFQEDSNGL